MGDRRESDYVKRNAGDLANQLNTSQEGNTTDRNQMAILFKALEDKRDKILRKSHLDGHRTDDMGKNIKDLDKVIALKTQETTDNNAQNRIMVLSTVKYQMGLILGIWDRC